MLTGWFSRPAPPEFVEEPLAELASAAEILSDARRIAAFGLRSGKLQDDRLFTLIAKIEAAMAANPQAADHIEVLAPLVAEMPRVQRAIAPMTLKELRKVDPFAMRRERRSEVWNRRVRFGLATVAVVVLGVLGCLLVWQNRASAVIADYALDHSGRFEAAMIDLVVMTERFRESTTDTKVSALELSAMGQKMNEATTALTRVNANAVLAERLNATFPYLGLWRWNDLAAEITSKPYSATPGPEVLEASAPGAGAGSAQAAPVTEGAGPGATAGSGEQADSPLAINCLTEDAAGQNLETLMTVVRQGDSSSARAFGASVNLYYAVRQMIDCVTGVGQMKLSLTHEQRPWATQDPEGNLTTKLMVTTSILIPALMGVLGSLIFHFRVYMDPLRPDIPLQRIVLRVFLGGFAGMATYFLLSKDALLSPDAEATGLAGLAIPFILGFSIDVFFRLLDRLVQQMNRWVDGIGTPPGGASGTGG